MTKLVRDNVPEIMERHGKQAIISETSGTDYAVALWEKFREECLELEDAIEEGKTREEILEEMADVVTVLEALARNVFKANLGTITEEKLNDAGGFEKGILLRGFEWID